MEAVFLRIFDIGISASCLIGAVIILRLLLRKVPKSFFYILWCIVGIRLMFPISITGSFSLIPDIGMEKYSETVMYGNMIDSEAGGIKFDNLKEDNTRIDNFEEKEGNTVQPDNLNGSYNNETDVNRSFSVIKSASIVWGMGMAVMVCYLCISSLLLKRRLVTAVPLQENIYQSDRIQSSFVFGIFRPSIYLPFSLGKDDIYYVVAHERMHICHKDYLVKIISFLVLSIYWFIPTVWLAWILFCHDMESFCDESVIRKLGQDEKKNYARALLNCAAKKEKLSVCPVAFGGAGIKGRIKNVLNYKKSFLMVNNSAWSDYGSIDSLFCAGRKKG